MLQADRNDEHLDRKLEILSRGIQGMKLYLYANEQANC
jgi:hypothetical protein